MSHGGNDKMRRPSSRSSNASRVSPEPDHPCSRPLLTNTAANSLILYPEHQDVEIITKVSVGEQRVDSRAIVAVYGPSGNLITLPLGATDWTPKSLYIETNRTPKLLFKKLDEVVKAALMKGKSDEESEELILVELDGAWKIEPEGKQVIMKEDV
jgi:hypothetical protein